MNMLSENKTDLLKGLGTIPALTVGVDGVRNLLGNNVEVLTTMKNIVGGTEGALEAGNSLLNPLFSQVLSTITAPLLTNSVLKKFDWMNEHQKTRWALNLAAGVGAYTTASTTAPLIMAGSLAYVLGKPAWHLSKGLANRVAGTAWGAIGGAGKGALKGAWNGLRHGNQFEGQGFGRLNPKIS